MVESLLDISARFVAKTVPFQWIEEKYEQIPEPVQRRVVFWSFPRNEQDICMYSSFSSSLSSKQCQKKLPFYQGLKLLEDGCVEDILQVGFQLIGTVIKPPTKEDNGFAAGSPLPREDGCKKYRVSVSFDRCKITSVTCTCGTRDIFWCQHVVALALYRIRFAETVTLRIPISETLLQMDRQQLQKFVQYLITEHCTEILPTAQRLADEILQQRSEINQIPGAPDPTAGGSTDSSNSWHLDEEQICKQVRSSLSQGGCCGGAKEIASMFTKVREMLRARDSNGPRMLVLITEELLADPRLNLWKTQRNPMLKKYRQLWDHLGALWVFVVLNPRISLAERSQWRQMLEKWSQVDVCPPENPDHRLIEAGVATRQQNVPQDDNMANGENGSRASTLRSLRPNFTARNRTVFHRALDSLKVAWDDPLLRAILCHDQFPVSSRSHSSGSFDSFGQPLWKENLPEACIRVETLHSHGYETESIRLAVAVVRNMREQQTKAMQNWRTRSSAAISGTANNSSEVPSCSEGWIGHPMNPVGCLFDALAEASLPPEDRNRRDYYFDVLGSNGDDESTASATPTRHQHIEVPHSADPSESYITLAVEAALIGLLQQRLMPPGLYSQDKVVKQEERLLQQLQEMHFDGALIWIVKRQALLALDSGPASGLGLGIHLESVPMHAVAKFLFKTLLPHDPDLAYRIGLRALRLPVLEGVDDLNEAEDRFPGSVNLSVSSPYSRWSVLCSVELLQCSLALTMLSTAKDDPGRLDAVMESVKNNIHRSFRLYSLAQEVYRSANPPEGSKQPGLLKAAFQLGLKVMRMTLSSENWKRREMVRWMINCAIETGFDALVTIMTDWEQFFTTTEATGLVASTLMSHSTVMHLRLDFSQQDQLSSCARNLALECATKDPQNCLLNALTLCEGDSDSFDKAYEIALGSASRTSLSPQLFSVGRYMENRGVPKRAFRLALLAMKNLNSVDGSNYSTDDVVWACSLSHSLGKSYLETMIPVLVDTVKSAPVLADVLRLCGSNPPGSAISLGSPPEAKKKAIKPLSYDKSPLKNLRVATIAAFEEAIHAKLTNISPRHYGDFIELLAKAELTFLLAADGARQFQQLISSMTTAYRGKKKLMALVKDQFKK